MTSKNEKNDSDYAWRLAKELCSDVGIEGDEAKIPVALLAKMHLDPMATSQVDPVPGYEDRLVAALMARAELEMPSVRSVSIEATHESSTAIAWYRMAAKLIPATVFSFVLVIGLALVQYMNKRPGDGKIAQEGLWAKAVENAPQGEVSRWIASVSDHGTQTWETSSDIAILSAQLNEGQLERVLKENGGS